MKLENCIDMNNYKDKDYMTVGNLITHLQKMIIEGKTTFESPVLWYSDDFNEYGEYQKPEKHNVHKKIQTFNEHFGGYDTNDEEYIMYKKEKAIVL